MSITTLGYVPYLRPGALLFTLIVFRHLHSGRGKETTLIDMYGTAGGRKRNLFGEHVATVTKRVFGDSIPSNAILLQHTLFGVYSRGLSPSVAEAWSNALITGSRRHYVRKSLRNLSSSVPFHLVTKNLRACCQCVAEDTDLFGFAQWRILHQIPSLLYCPEHGHQLHDEACGGPGGNIWQYALPHGKHSDHAREAAWAASDGHASYLDLWKQLFDGNLPVVASHRWAPYMDLVVAQIGNIASADAEIENTICRTWWTDSASIKSALGFQISSDFIRAELSHNSAPARLAQRLIVLGATTTLGIQPPKTDDVPQLRLNLGAPFGNSASVPLQLRLRDFLLDAGLPGFLAPLLLNDQNATEVARAAGLHRGRIWRAMERIPNQLLEEIAAAQKWSSESWLTYELQMRQNKRPSRIRR